MDNAATLHTHHWEQDFAIPVCLEHSGICKEIQGLKEDRAADNALNEKNHAAQWRAIEGMRRWVVSGMAALLLGVFTWILSNLHIIK